MNYGVRREDLLSAAKAKGADCVLVASPVNVHYLTGLRTSNGALIVASQATVLVTDARYLPKAREVCPEIPLELGRDVDAVLGPRIAEFGSGRVLFEDHVLTVERYRGLKAAAPRAEFIPGERIVEGLRRVKSEEEIDLLRRACSISDQALADVLGQLRPGLSERWIAQALTAAMFEHGAHGLAFEPIVAAGPNGASPHHAPGDRPVTRGDLVTMDFGASYGGYHADMTRTVALGSPSAWQRDIYALVAEAQRTGISHARPDTDVRDVDASARNMITSAGYGEFFPHGFGHGVGLEIQEWPMLGYGRTGKLMDRVPITAEPGVYLTGRGGVRIEDTFVVRADGPELLTTTTKDLLVL
ncbi:M24 family metallopeptidase [Actinomadura monticuli]|uniref:Xaa-Pro peptidase family protein n=1 Tax=Actinomadura monticuli TaxID=3097367 RepID=A0ABV4QG82_9ACTN